MINLNEFFKSFLKKFPLEDAISLSEGAKLLIHDVLK